MSQTRKEQIKDDAINLLEIHGDLLTSEIRDTLIDEKGYDEEDKDTIHRQLLTVRKELDSDNRFSFDEEYGKSSIPEWRWIIE